MLNYALKRKTIGRTILAVIWGIATMVSARGILWSGANSKWMQGVFWMLVHIF